MGRVKLFETSEQIWNAFCEYEKWVKINPRKRMQFVGKDGDKVWEELERPLTLEGFEEYCLENYSDVHNYMDNTEGRYEDYKAICSRIKKAIRCDQIEGGLVGQYNPSITQRLNNLVDKTETHNTGTVKVLNIDPLDDTADNSPS